jgi:TP901 family phage tail tape measure protein
LNGVMNIRIQVMANQARTAIAQVQGDLSRLAVAGGAAGAGVAGKAGVVGGLEAASRSMIKAGSQSQWLGRQLTYNLTLPLALAGGAGLKFATDNEQAMTRVIKVYGDASMSAQQVRNETTALGKTFEVLSEQFGVARDQVIGIAADWAAAGSSGVALAKQVQLTLQTMVLGELDAADATQALIAIQAQYGQSSTELADTIARLNNVENQTGTTMGDLIQSMARSAGVARAAGVDVAHLAAMTAALVPAAGSASQAGNALKTIISRLLSPTKDAQDILGAMGIGISDVSWKSADAATRIELLSKHFEGLSDAQKGVVSATLASRYQINKFEVLMDAVANKTSYYWKGLDAATNRTQYLAQVQRELNQVLDSSPKKFDRIKVMLQNTLADAMQPLLPVITGIGMGFAELAKRFNELSPHTQKIVIEFLALLALLGPMIKLFATFRQLIGIFGLGLAMILKPLIFVTGGLWSMVAAMTAAAWGAFTGILGMIGGGFIRLAAIIPFTLNGFKVFGLVLVGTLSLGLQAITTFGALALRVWPAIWTRMLLFTGVFTSQLPRLIGAGLLNAFSAIAVVMLPIANTLVAGLSRVGFLASEAFYGGLVVAMTLTRRFFATLQGIMVASGPILASAMQVVGAFITAAWETTWFAITYVVQVWGPKVAGAMTALGALLSKVWTAVGTALIFIQETLGAALTRIWALTQAAMATIASVGGRVLAVTVAATGRGLALLWVGISRGMVMLWSVAWGGMKAITMTGGRVLMGLVTQLGPFLLKALTNPWVLAAVAVGLALYAMRDKLKGIWDSIVKFFQNAIGSVVKAFYALPVGVQKAIMAVVNIVKTAAMKVYELFSYLNPFAHHSPSLVENVTNGMGVVVDQFSRITDIEGPINSAYSAIARFKNAAKDLANGYDSIKTANEVADLKDAGASPGLIASYVELAGRVSALKDIQQGLSNAIASQQKVVKGWQDRLDAANAVLDAQQKKLSDLKDVASAYGDQISALKDDMSTLTDTPIKGMQAFDDAIFSNQQAQKRLQLQMLQTAAAGGASYQDLQSNIASVQGEIEKLMGEQSSLRSKGAGSDILGQYDDQVKALKAQQKTLTGQANSVGDIQKQLDDLSNQGQILDLQKSLQFDGLTRQIQQAANAMQEMPFDQIMAGIQKDKAGIADLTGKYNAANAAVDAQQKAVDAAQASVDSIKASYDAQNKSLQSLQDSYDSVTNAIQDMTQAMSDANSAASALKQAKDPALSPTMANFEAGAGGNFPDVSGSGLLGREGGLGDQTAQIDAMTKDLQKQLGDAFGGFDLLGPFKDMWNKFVGWWTSTAWPWLQSIFKPIGQLFSNIFGGIDLGGAFSNIFGNIDWSGIFTKAWNVITNVFSTVWDFGKLLWSFIGPDIQDILGQVIGFFKDMFSRVGTVFSDIKDRIGPFLDALNTIWNLLKPFLAFMAGEFLVGIKFVFSLIKNIMAPVFEWIGSMFHAIWEVIRGFLDIFIGIFTGDWKRVWDGILSIFKGVWDAIVGTFKAIGGILWGILKSIGETLYSIGSFIIGGIWNGIKAAWNAFWGWIKGLWQSFIDFIKGVFGISSPSTVMAEIGGWIIEGLWNGIKAIWNMLVSWFMGIVHVIWDALSPVFDLIEAGWNALLSAMTWVWENVLKPAWDAIAAAAGWLWNTILKPYFTAIGVAWGLLMDGISWVWENVLKPAWDAISAAASWLWNTVLKPIFGFWQDWWRKLMFDISWVWQNVLKPVWDAISTAAGWLWNTILKPIFDAIGKAWSAMGDGFSWVYDHVIHPVFDTFGKIIDTIKSGFQTAVDFIGQVWQTLGGILMKPVQWVIDFVWNNGLRKLWNWINNIWGGDDIDPFVLGFSSGGVINSASGRMTKALAKGGVLPGYSPGKDIHRFVSPTGGILNLSGGEAVMRPEFTRALGTESINLLNHVARHDGATGVLQTLAGMMGPERAYAEGGVLDVPGWLKVALKFVPGGGLVTDIIDQVNSGNGAGGGSWASMIWGMIKKTASGVWDAVKQFFGGGDGDGTGGGGTGMAGVGAEQIKQFIKAADPLPYIWGGVGPGGYDCSGLAGEVWALMTGHQSFRRYFTTASIGNGSQFGFKPGLGGILNLGFNDHHVVGEYGGLGFEAQSTATGILTGSAATPPSRMPKQMHMAGGGIMTMSDLAKLLRDGVAIGGDPSRMFIGADNVFDQGGMMRSMGLNLTGRPERVLSPGQTRNFERLTTILDRVDFVNLEGRLNGSEAAGQSVVYNVQGDTTIINLNGDLVLPNISNGKDAETFIRNLEDMAGGSKK